MLTNPEFKELLNFLESNNCRYLIIGGYAVMKYTEPRYTKDLDLLIATDEQNANAVFKALKDFGAPLKGLTEKDFTQPGHFYKMGRAPLRVDVLMSVPGVDFGQAWARRETQVIAGVTMHFISKSDLIAAKKAAGRPLDLIDVAALERTEKTS